MLHLKTADEFPEDASDQDLIIKTRIGCGLTNGTLEIVDGKVNCRHCDGDCGKCWPKGVIGKTV